MDHFPSSLRKMTNFTSCDWKAESSTMLLAVAEMTTAPGALIVPCHTIRMGFLTTWQFASSKPARERESSKSVNKVEFDIT